MNWKDQTIPWADFWKLGWNFGVDLFGVTIPSWKNLGVWKVIKTFQRHFRGQENHPTPNAAPVYHFHLFSVHVQPCKGKTAACHHWWHTWINHLRRGGGAVQFGSWVAVPTSCKLDLLDTEKIGQIFEGLVVGWFFVTFFMGCLLIHADIDIYTL